MSMMDKLKDLNELRKHGKELKELQGQLAKEQAVGTSADGKVTVILDGNQNILSVHIDDAIVGDKVQLEKSVKDAIFRSLDALKKMMAAKFSSFLK